MVRCFGVGEEGSGNGELLRIEINADGQGPAEGTIDGIAFASNGCAFVVGASGDSITDGKVAGFGNNAVDEKEVSIDGELAAGKTRFPVGTADGND